MLKKLRSRHNKTLGICWFRFPAEIQSLSWCRSAKLAHRKLCKHSLKGLERFSLNSEFNNSLLWFNLLFCFAMQSSQYLLLRVPSYKSYKEKTFQILYLNLARSGEAYTLLSFSLSFNKEWHKVFQIDTSKYKKI